VPESGRTKLTGSWQSAVTLSKTPSFSTLRTTTAEALTGLRQGDSKLRVLEIP
jgi:hypothetical protein